jgi:DNA uptake protein ComE-like DNA-binding protein
MGSSLRKMRREIKPSAPLNIKLLEQLAYDCGYNEGAAEQRKLDIQSVVKLLDGLEELPGIGKKTANKIQYFVSNKFGK